MKFNHFLLVFISILALLIQLKSACLSCRREQLLPKMKVYEKESVNMIISSIDACTEILPAHLQMEMFEKGDTMVLENMKRSFSNFSKNQRNILRKYGIKQCFTDLYHYLGMIYVC